MWTSPKLNAKRRLYASSRASLILSSFSKTFLTKMECAAWQLVVQASGALFTLRWFPQFPAPGPSQSFQLFRLVARGSWVFKWFLGWGWNFNKIILMCNSCMAELWSTLLALVKYITQSDKYVYVNLDNSTAAHDLFCCVAELWSAPLAHSGNPTPWFMNSHCQHIEP